VRVIYLHGFASSARSTKARLLAERLAQYGIGLESPDFNLPSFQTLTITRMLEQAREAIARGPGPVVLIGSSLGAFVAVHAAARHREVDRLILLAPALDFATNRMRDLGSEGLARWKADDRLDIFHYGYGRVMPVGYALYEDAGQYDALGLDVPMPALVFQGTRDTVVEPSVAERFAASRPNVTLRLLDDDHQLLASLPLIWEESREFLGLPAPP
jgi:uncharacterized protein